MHLDLDIGQRARDRDRFVVAPVVNDDDMIDNAVRHDFIMGAAQCARGIIRWHHHHDLFAIQHRLFNNAANAGAASAFPQRLQLRRQGKLSSEELDRLKQSSWIAPLGNLVALAMLGALSTFATR